MGNNIENEYSLNQIMEYNGNDEKFKLLNEKLDKPFNYRVIYEDKEKTKIKYNGQLSRYKFEGRGILYSGNSIYDGYFKNGEKMDILEYIINLKY